MNLPAERAITVRDRAANRCQYCLMHQSLQGATFHVEHIIPKSKGGSSDLPNLALACQPNLLRSRMHHEFGLSFLPFGLVHFFQFMNLDEGSLFIADHHDR